MARIIEINSAHDERLRRYAKLRADAARPLDAASFVVEGRWCLRRLIDSGHPIMSVLVERGKEQEVAHLLPGKTPVYSLPPEQIRQLVGFDFHRGVLACGERPNLRSVDDLNFGSQTPTMALAILGVSDPENLGSIMRTAAALGVEHLLVGPKTEDPLSRRSIRVSMASVFHQTLYRLDQPEHQLRELQQVRGFRTIVTVLDDDATPLDEFVADDRDSILILGNEAEGVEPSIQCLATDRVTIPMKLGIDSLNVSIAAAIFLYQLIRSGQGTPRQAT